MTFARHFPRIREAMKTYEAIEHKTRYETEGLPLSYEALAMAYSALANQENSHSKKANDLHQAQTWLQKKSFAGLGARLISRLDRLNRRS